MPTKKRETIWKWPVDLNALDEEDAVVIDFPFGARPLYAAVQDRRIVVYAIVDPDEKDILRRRVHVTGTGRDMTFSTTGKISLGVVPLVDATTMLHVFVGPYSPHEYMEVYGRRNGVDMFADKSTGWQRPEPASNDAGADQDTGQSHTSRGGVPAVSGRGERPA